MKDQAQQILIGYIVTKILEALATKFPALKIVLVYRFASAIIYFIAEAMIETKLVVIDIRKTDDLIKHEAALREYYAAIGSGKSDLIKEKENEVIISFNRFIKFG